MRSAERSASPTVPQAAEPTEFFSPDNIAAIVGAT